MPSKISPTQWVLLLSLIVTGVLYAVPQVHFLAWPMILISTLAHEMGHGLAGLLMGYHFDSFKLFSDASGVAHVYGPSGRMAQAFVAFGGLLGPAFFAMLFFILAKSESLARFSLSVLGVLLIIADFLVVRNAFGLAFVGVIAAICLFVAQQKQSWPAPFFLVLLATQLALSVFSRGDYLFTKMAQTANGPMPSDVSQIAQALFLPYWFWGALCAMLSLVILLLGIRSYLK